MTDEKTIISKLSRKETMNEGFSLLVNQYSEQLYWQIRHIVTTHEDTNDILQNALLKAWTNIHSFEGKSKLITWLSRIAINEALDFIRKEKHKADTDTDDTLVARLIADPYFDGDETEAQLQEAIAQLPDVQRTVFVMRYYQNIKYSEISKRLNTTEGALKASYHMAVKKIEKYFNSID